MVDESFAQSYATTTYLLAITYSFFLFIVLSLWATRRHKAFGARQLLVLEIAFGLTCLQSSLVFGGGVVRTNQSSLGCLLSSAVTSLLLFVLSALLVIHALLLTISEEGSTMYVQRLGRDPETASRFYSNRYARFGSILAWLAPVILHSILATTSSESYTTDDYCWFEWSSMVVWVAFGPAAVCAAIAFLIYIWQFFVVLFTKKSAARRIETFASIAFFMYFVATCVVCGLASWTQFLWLNCTITALVALQTGVLWICQCVCWAPTRALYAILLNSLLCRRRQEVAQKKLRRPDLCDDFTVEVPKHGVLKHRLSKLLLGPLADESLSQIVLESPAVVPTKPSEPDKIETIKRDPQAALVWELERVRNLRKKDMSKQIKTRGFRYLLGPEGDIVVLKQPTIVIDKLDEEAQKYETAWEDFSLASPIPPELQLQDYVEVDPTSLLNMLDDTESYSLDLPSPPQDGKQGRERRRNQTGEFIDDELFSSGPSSRSHRSYQQQHASQLDSHLPTPSPSPLKSTPAMSSRASIHKSPEYHSTSSASSYRAMRCTVSTREIPQITVTTSASTESGNSLVPRQREATFTSLSSERRTTFKHHSLRGLSSMSGSTYSLDSTTESDNDELSESESTYPAIVFDDFFARAPTPTKSVVGEFIDDESY